MADSTALGKGLTVVVGDSATARELIGALLQTSAMSEEGLALTRSDGAVAAEVLAAMRLDGAVSREQIGMVQADRIVRGESSGQVAGASPRLGLEYIGSISTNSPICAERAAKILSDLGVVDEQVLSIQASVKAAGEHGGVIVVDASLNAEHFREVSISPRRLFFYIRGGRAN